MVKPTTILSGLTAFLTLEERADRKEAEREKAETGETPQSAPTDMQMVGQQEQTTDKLDRLIEIEEKNRPSPGDKDAFSSSTFDLNDGETAEITVEPASGFHLRVKKVYLDRRADHSYEFNVAGDVTSVSHQAVYTSPKLVTQSDRVVARVTNNSGGTTSIDFELEAWAEQPSKSRGHRGR